MCFEYSDFKQFKRKIKSISGGCKATVRFLGADGFKGEGYVAINGTKHAFASTLAHGDGSKPVYAMDRRSYAAIRNAFREEAERKAREKEDIALCHAMLEGEPFTRFWLKNGKFAIESENFIYRKARNPDELLTMIANVKGK